ncbi:hypothetical protein D3C75_891840 [compost metagenome]
MKALERAGNHQHGIGGGVDALIPQALRNSPPQGGAALGLLIAQGYRPSGAFLQKPAHLPFGQQLRRQLSCSQADDTGIRLHPVNGLDHRQIRLVASAFHHRDPVRGRSGEEAPGFVDHPGAASRLPLYKPQCHQLGHSLGHCAPVHLP